MRISLKFFAKKLVLPVHYNHLLQSFIYNTLDDTLAQFYHNKGYSFLRRQFKLFTFSRLLTKNRKFNPNTRTITFHGLVNLKIGSVDGKLLESIASYLVKKGSFRLGRHVCELESIEVEMPILPDGPVLVKALSPITIRSTLSTPEGKKKNYFYTPFEAEFSEKLLENLKRKARAYLGEEADLPELSGSYIRPVRVSKKNEAIVNFKGYWIKGWTGLYEVNLPRPYFELAYDAGLGAKNSQGFGMIEVVREGR